MDVTYFTKDEGESNIIFLILLKNHHHVAHFLRQPKGRFRHNFALDNMHVGTCEFGIEPSPDALTTMLHLRFR